MGRERRREFKVGMMELGGSPWAINAALRVKQSWSVADNSAWIGVVERGQLMLFCGEASVRRRNDEMPLHSPTNECVECGFPGRIKEEIAEEARQESCEKKGGRCWLCCMGHAILPMQFAPTLEQGRRAFQGRPATLNLQVAPPSLASTATSTSLPPKSFVVYACFTAVSRASQEEQSFLFASKTPAAACMNDALPTLNTPLTDSPAATLRGVGTCHRASRLESPQSANYQFDSHGTDDRGPKRFHISSELRLTSSRPFRQNWECQWTYPCRTHEPLSSWVAPTSNVEISCTSHFSVRC